MKIIYCLKQNKTLLRPQTKVIVILENTRFIIQTKKVEKQTRDLNVSFHNLLSLKNEKPIKYIKRANIDSSQTLPRFRKCFPTNSMKPLLAS